MTDNELAELEDNDPHGVGGLLQTALYDTGGERVEGGFVDHWVSNAWVALDELKAIFEQHGFSAADAARLRTALHEAGVPGEAAVKLLTALDRWSRPMSEAMLTDPQPHARLIAMGAGQTWLTLDHWLAALADPDAQVRGRAVKLVPGPLETEAAVQTRLRAALNDVDPGVRTAAGLRLKFYRDPAGGEALAAFFVAETDPQVRNALLSRIADQVRSAGISVAYDKLAGYMGEPIKALLLRELNNPDAEVRRAIASALERLRGAEVAEAMLARLRLEADQTVKAVLALFNGFAVIAEQSLPVLASLLAADPNPTIRTRVAFLLGSFGQPAVPLLLAALADEPARRAAVMSLGPLGPLSVLPHLLHQLIDPANKSIERELESAVSSVVARAAAAADPHPLPSPELSAHIQARIDALQPDPFRAWPIRLCKEELNALPLHGNQIYLWALQPDGTLLSLDHEAFRQPVEPETDPLTRFAVMVHGTRTYPELAALLPAPPQGIRVCLVCLGNGRWSDEQDRGQACQSCGGLGWRFFKRPA